jgi:hypothetical protein
VTPTCPRCGSDDVLEIFPGEIILTTDDRGGFGLVHARKQDAERVWSGGCLPDPEKWICRTCLAAWPIEFDVSPLSEAATAYRTYPNPIWVRSPR